MLPISLLRAAQGYPMLVELKNGETYNGNLSACDTWMNIHLKDAICTSRDGDKFWKVPEVYIRGATIKYLRIPDQVLDTVKEDIQSKQKAARPQDNKPMRGKGQRGGRGGGRGGSKPRGGARNV